MDNSDVEPVRRGPVDAETYLKERVEDRIAWCDHRSTFNKKMIHLVASRRDFLCGFAGNP
jgi:hypothetical protein